MKKSVFLSAIAVVLLVLVVSVVVASVNAANPNKAPFEFSDVKVSDYTKIAAVVVSNDSEVPLKKENVSVTVDNQAIGDFSLTPVNDESTALILAIDVSRSMNGIPIANAKKYASYLLAPFIDGNYMTLMTFGSYVKVLENLSDDKNSLTGKIDSITALEQKTLLYSGISEGIKLAEKSKTAKTSMLVITDAMDEHSNIPIETLMKDVKKPHIPIHVMIYGSHRQYFEPLDNITKLTKGMMLVNPSFQEIQSLSRAIFIPKRVKYLIDYNYSGPTGKHVCLVKLKYRGEDIELKREFTIPALNAHTPESTPRAATESKAKEETAVAELSFKELVQSYQWLLLLIIVLLLFVIVIILLLRKDRKSGDSSVASAIKAMQDELKKVTTGIAEMKPSELIITDNERIESFIQGLLNEFIAGIQENLKNILRRLEMETKNAISNVRETKSQEFLTLEQNIALLTDTINLKVISVENSLDTAKEYYKTELTGSADKTLSNMKGMFVETASELKQALTGEFSSKIAALSVAVANKEPLKDLEKRLEDVYAFIAGIPPMRNAFEKHQLDIDGKLSTLAVQLTELKQNAQKPEQTVTEQEKIDYEKITDATKETLKDFEKRLETVSKFIAGVPPMKSAFMQHQSDIEGKLSGLSAEMASLKDTLTNVIKLLASMQSQEK